MIGVSTIRKDYEFILLGKVLVSVRRVARDGRFT